MTYQTSTLLSYQIVGDNVDLHQQATHHSMDQRDKDHHCFHIYAVRDRICDLSLADSAAIAKVSTMPLKTFLPAAADCYKLQTEFSTLIGRVLVKNLSFFPQFQENVSDHIKHHYSADMAKKSEIVSYINFKKWIVNSDIILSAGPPWRFNQI